MNEQALPMVTSLPAMAFLIPFVAGVLVFLGWRLRSWFWLGLSMLASLATSVIGFVMCSAVLDGFVLTCWGNQLRVDGLSALMVVVIGSLGFLATLYSVRYLRKDRIATHTGKNQVPRKLRVFHGLLLWFLATMVWGSVTNNLIMLFLAVEGSTLASGLLVTFYWDRRALEAGYKYLMLLAIGITFALFGCVLIYVGAAGANGLDGGNALLISEVRGVVHLIPTATAAITAAFLIIGFGTKAGLAPFHPWLPDAHAEAPIPISVLLSGVMIKMAVYALARTVSIFFPALPAMTVFIVAMGTFTMLLGIIMALTQDDLKRFLAYSSVSQMGYIVAGVGLGTYLGCYGGLFHLLNHAIFKALLFMCVGAIIYTTGLRRISELGGLRRKMPITSACFFIGALAIAGFPPFNGFMSKFTIYLALAKAEMWWAVVLALFTGILTMVALVRAAFLVFWGKTQGGDLSRLEVKEVPATMWVPMVILAIACLLIGVFPQMAYPLLNDAAAILATLGR